MNFYHFSFLPFLSFLLMTESRFWELEQNTRNTLNSRVSKWALKFLAVKPRDAAGNSRAVNSEERKGFKRFAIQGRRERRDAIEISRGI